MEIFLLAFIAIILLCGAKAVRNAIGCIVLGFIILLAIGHASRPASPDEQAVQAVATVKHNAENSTYTDKQFADDRAAIYEAAHPDSK